jgi:hypothetical protein
MGFSEPLRTPWMALLFGVRLRLDVDVGLGLLRQIGLMTTKDSGSANQ